MCEVPRIPVAARAGYVAVALLIMFSVGHSASLASGPSGSSGDGLALADWTAPPYWVPTARDGDVHGRPEPVPGRSSPQPFIVLGQPLPFFAIAPCRLADTRPGQGFSGAWGPPSLFASTIRDFPIAGQCEIPSNAQAVSFNLTTTGAQGPGFIAIYPQGTAYPGVSTLNYLAGQTLANAAIVGISTSGAVSVVAGVSGTDLIMDVNGYYAPSGMVTSVSGLRGDVTLAAGSNVTITPSGNTLTIAVPLTNLNASNVTSGLLGITFGGTGGSTAAGARANLSAAGSGANTDITSLTNLTTPLSIVQGGTGSATPFQNTFQARITGTCASGSFFVGVNANGSAACGAPVVNPRPVFTRTVIDSASYSYSGTIAIGADGLALAAYQDPGGPLRIAHCSDVACTSSTISVVAVTGGQASVAIGADGLGLISFASLTGLSVAHCNDTACSGLTSSVVESGSAGRFSQIAIGTDGLGLITYQDPSGAVIKTAHCNNTACSSSTISALGANGFDLALAIGADGLGLISYYSSSTHLMAAHCNDLACTSATTSLLDAGDKTGLAGSLTIGADGLGVIAHVDVFNGIKLAHCNNTACTSATTTVLDSAKVFSDTSITIGTDGLGLMSYYDLTNGLVKVAHCRDLACTGASISTLDVTGASVGKGSSITIGADGMGLVAYQHQASATLKIAHCANSLCTPFVRRR